MPADKEPDSGAAEVAGEAEPEAVATPEEVEHEDAVVADQDQPRSGEAAPQPDNTFFIVGIGASAGGLEALTALLSNIKLDCMAFVVVQHLAPKHESFLPALLSRTSNIKAELATDGLKVEPNHVYVIPPNADLAVLQGVLHVMPPPHQTAAIHG